MAEPAVVEEPRDEASQDGLLVVEGLKKYFPVLQGIIFVAILAS